MKKVMTVMILLIAIVSSGCSKQPAPDGYHHIQVGEGQVAMYSGGANDDVGVVVAIRNVHTEDGQPVQVLEIKYKYNRVIPQLPAPGLVFQVGDEVVTKNVAFFGRYQAPLAFKVLKK